LRERRDINFSSDDLSAWRDREMGGEKASAAKQKEGPVTPMKRGSGRRVSIVSLEVNETNRALTRSIAAPLMTRGPISKCMCRRFLESSALPAPLSSLTKEANKSTLLGSA